MKNIEFKNGLINHIITTANSKENNFRKIHAAEQMVYNMAGNHNKDKRQIIYSELTGKKATKAESGVNNILLEIKKYIVLNEEPEHKQEADKLQKIGTVEDVLNELITNRENNLSVRSKTLILNKDSLANPKIQVGTIPFYEWQNDKRITYIVCYGRYITCEMLVYEKLLNGYEYLKTQDKEEAKNYIRKIIKNAASQQDEKTEQAQEQAHVKPQTHQEIIEKPNVTIVNYSDKAIAIFGDTKSIKEKLKDIGARFNPFLMKDGVKTAGWILPVTKQTLLNSII